MNAEMRKLAQEAVAEDNHQKARRDFAQLQEMVEQRNALYYQWLRQVVTMAGGGLSILVALKTGEGSTGMALMFLRLTWLLTGLGILAGSLATFGEVAQARHLAAMRREAILTEMKRVEDNPGAIYQPAAPAVANLEKWRQWSATLCTTSLTIAVVALIGFALTR